jgi:HPt (histidine-containing phosphotransfer) domain-containing protein
MAWDISVININEAITRSMGRKELYKGWLDSFFKDETLDLVKSAFENKDEKALEKALHKIKGTSGNLSVVKVYDIASDMCRRVEANETINGLEVSFNELCEEFKAAKQMYNNNLNDLLNYGEIII